VHALSLAGNDSCVLPWVDFVLLDRLQAHVDQLLASISVVIILCVCNCEQLVGTFLQKQHVAISTAF